MHFKSIVTGTALALMVPVLAVAAPSGQIFGWEEQGLLIPGQTPVRIELDTSAESSSLVAANIEPFDKNGEKWVRFTLQVPTGLTGALVDVPLERKVLRSEKGKALVGGGGHRQVIGMTLCIGNKAYQEELLLKSRGKKDYTVILGRSSLQHLGAVDVTLSNTVKPDCGSAADKHGS